MKLIKFYATWCGPCRMMKSVVEEFAKEQNLELQDVDIDQNPSMANTYGIMSVPTTILVDEENKVVEWQAGYISKPLFTDKFGKHIQK